MRRFKQYVADMTLLLILPPLIKVTIVYNALNVSALVCSALRVLSVANTCANNKRHDTFCELFFVILPVIDKCHSETNAALDYIGEWFIIKDCT